MEELYKDDKIKVKMQVIKRIYNKLWGDKSTHIYQLLYQFHIYLQCGNMLWAGCCSTCAQVEIKLLGITHRDKVWLNVGRGFLVFHITKLGHFANIVYCIDAAGDRVFHKNPCLKGDAHIL